MLSNNLFFTINNKFIKFIIAENPAKKPKETKKVYGPIMPRIDVEKKLKEKLFAVKKNENGTADYWKSYQMIVDDKNVPTNYVQCKFCSRIDEYNTLKGTRGLKSHASHCNSVSAKSSVKPFIQREIILSKEEKSALNLAALEFCYKDLRPFTSIKGEGCRSLLLAISRLSSKYGSFSEEQLDRHLLSPNSVR